MILVVRLYEMGLNRVLNGELKKAIFDVRVRGVNLAWRNLFCESMKNSFDRIKIFEYKFRSFCVCELRVYTIRKRLNVSLSLATFYSPMISVTVFIYWKYVKNSWLNRLRKSQILFQLLSYNTSFWDLLDNFAVVVVVSVDVSSSSSKD